QQNRGVLERWRVDRGDRSLRELQHRHLQGYISKLATPHVQRNALRAIRHFLKFCLSKNLIDSDPSAGVQKRKLPKGGGFRAWEESHVAAYIEKHPLGSTAYLALQTLLCTALRRSDAVEIGPRHVSKTKEHPLGILADYLPKKGRRTGGNRVNVPIH